MILYCDFDPEIVTEITLESPGSNNAEEIKRYVSGSGIYMALFTEKMMEDKRLIHIRGENFIDSDLSSKDPQQIVKIKDKNVEKFLIKPGDRLIKTSPPRITMEEKNDILAKFTSYSKECDIIVISDMRNSVVSEIAQSIFRIAHQSGKKILTTHKNLEDFKRNPVDVIVMDKSDFGESIHYMKDLRNKVNEVIDTGVEIVFVISKHIAIFTPEKSYRVISKAEEQLKYIDKDLLLSGFAIGLKRNYGFKTCVKLAISAASCEDFKNSFQLKSSSIKENMNKFILEEV